jgi:hypothetical protein
VTAPPEFAAALAPVPGPGAGHQPAAARARQLWLRWRDWIAIALLVAIAGTVIGLMQAAPANTYLSPASTTGSGTRALADVLSGLGRQVTAETSVSAAAAAAKRGTTLVITSPGYLSRRQLAVLAAVPASLLLIEPDARSLDVIAPGVRLAATSRPVRLTPPGCGLSAAVLAGPADLGGTVMSVTAPGGQRVQECYRSGPGAALVVLTAAGRTVAVAGTAAPLTNANLAAQGNAALAINLLATHRIIWLVPPVAVVPASTAAGPRSFVSLVPLAAWLVVIQLGIALLLAAGWRARRLGPLVAEPLPVVVRAAETVEGHGRLYEARKARARAAEVLRSALLHRITPAAGLPPRPGPDAVVAALAPRSGRDPAQIGRLLYGDPPGTDRELTELARDLDDFEREVGKS